MKIAAFIIILAVVTGCANRLSPTATGINRKVTVKVSYEHQIEAVAIVSERGNVRVLIDEAWSRQPKNVNRLILRIHRTEDERMDSYTLGRDWRLRSPEFLDLEITEKDVCYFSRLLP